MIIYAVVCSVVAPEKDCCIYKLCTTSPRRLLLSCQVHSHLYSINIDGRHPVQREKNPAEKIICQVPAEGEPYSNRMNTNGVRSWAAVTRTD